ncbi:MAG: LysE family translocator [Culturomica sp.]|jgi:threonine/homoserine/homoserine lactone efflux protein|nr:LysE family translocator [Culturomica sp.]
MYDVIYIFRGMLIGLMISVPLGPMGVLIIQKTLHKGALSGFVAGMGAAFADLFYAIMAAFGIGLFVNVIQTHEILLRIIGGIFLLIVGLKIYFDNPLKRIKSRRRVTKKGLLGDFLSLFFLTASNPITIIVFMAVFAGTSVLGGDAPGLLPEIFVLAGVLLGAAAWWYTLSTVVNIFRKKFKLRVLISINRITGIVITILGGGVILAAFVRP